MQPTTFYASGPPANSYFWIKVAAIGRWLGLDDERRWLVARFVAYDTVGRWAVPALPSLTLDGQDDFEIEDVDVFLGSTRYFQGRGPAAAGLAALDQALPTIMAALDEGDGEPLSNFHRAVINRELSNFFDHLYDVLRGGYDDIYESDVYEKTILLELPL